MAQLGAFNQLPFIRRAPPGCYLDGGPHGEILLPTRYASDAANPGQLLRVFVYRDSDDRLVATTEQPLAVVGEFAALRVTAYRPRLGFFLDWGLVKDLLLPLRETLRAVAVGSTVVVRILLDEQTDRLVASARIDRFLDRTPPHYHEGEAVRLLVASRSPLGFNVIVNHAHRAMIYQTEAPQFLAVGQAGEGYIRAVRPDGKLDVAFGRAGPGRVSGNAGRVLERLTAARHGRLPFHDGSLPEEIRDAFGLSKKAFKQAIGALYKERRIVIESDAIRLPDAPARRAP